MTPQLSSVFPTLPTTTEFIGRNCFGDNMVSVFSRKAARRMEAFDREVGARTSTFSKVKAALEKGGIEFVDDERQGVRLKSVKSGH